MWSLLLTNKTQDTNVKTQSKEASAPERVIVLVHSKITKPAGIWLLRNRVNRKIPKITEARRIDAASTSASVRGRSRREIPRASRSLSLAISHGIDSLSIQEWDGEGGLRGTV